MSFLSTPSYDSFLCELAMMCFIHNARNSSALSYILLRSRPQTMYCWFVWLLDAPSLARILVVSTSFDVLACLWFFFFTRQIWATPDICCSEWSCEACNHVRTQENLCMKSGTKGPRWMIDAAFWQTCREGRIPLFESILAEKRPLITCPSVLGGHFQPLIVCGHIKQEDGKLVRLAFISYCRLQRPRRLVNQATWLLQLGRVIAAAKYQNKFDARTNLTFFFA
jgi:hypothetical protein